jgi:lysophospholipase L1-like esterase
VAHHRPLRRALVLAACYAAALLAAGGAYELHARSRYRAWRAGFDNYGWLGALTVPSADPVLLWEYKPYGRYQGPMGEIAVNRFGFREADTVAQEKPVGTLRVAFVGDSVTLGLLNPPAQTFVRQFEAAANGGAPAARVEALNFGVDGYDALQIARLLSARALAFAPDRVVYALCLNDFDFEWSSGDKQRYFRPPASFLLAGLEALWVARSGVDFHAWVFRKHREAVFEAVRGMRDAARARGAGLLVAIVPVFGPQPFGDYALGWVHEQIAAFLAAEGIAHVDLLEVFRSSGLAPAQAAHDLWHPNARGSALIAQSLLRPVLSAPPAD